MSRSKHTDPRAIRALRRLRAPFERRSANDLSLRRRLGKVAMESASGTRYANRDTQPRRLRVLIQAPRPGFHHPVSKRQILEFLGAVGPTALYGLRSIELVRQPNDQDYDHLRFGRYEAPGRILLLEQPKSPWRLPGLLKDKDMLIFKQAGALVSCMSDAQVTIVKWPKGALERFMLEEVLLHELGHHVFQHDKGKRLPRVARTSDHEATAARFAARQRPALFQRQDK